MSYKNSLHYLSIYPRYLVLVVMGSCTNIS